tara:strand:+ start:166 stop:765 length:600 start_codon:yes stop_codon:yes gene_type:complete
MKDKPILEFAKLISGIYCNKEQALRNPRNFAHIQIHFRPLDFNFFGCYAFYSEQRYQHDIWNPYKQGINILTQKEDLFIMSNYKIENKHRFTGGALNVSLLSQISKCKLYKLSGCSMHFKENYTGNFIGKLEPGEKCYVQKGNTRNYVKSDVILNKNNLITEDSGYEKETKRKVWGSNFGPLLFNKIENFDKFIDSNWE